MEVGSLMTARRDRVIPRRMNFVATELDLFQLLVGHFDSDLIVICVQHCFDFESGARLRATDEVDDRLIVDQRLSSPVQTDEREEPVLDLVPLAGSRRVVTDRDRYPDLIRYLLQVELPCAKSISVARPFLTGLHLPVDVPELSIPVGVLWSLLRLAVGLQRIPHIVQATRYRHPCDGVS